VRWNCEIGNVWIFLSKKIRARIHRCAIGPDGDPGRRLPRRRRVGGRFRAREIYFLLGISIAADPYDTPIRAAACFIVVVTDVAFAVAKARVWRLLPFFTLASRAAANARCSSDKCRRCSLSETTMAAALPLRGRLQMARPRYLLSLASASWFRKLPKSRPRSCHL
jgi:hypothetical protein